MANKKITELTEETSPQGADLLALVDDVSGTPTTKKVTVTNLMGQAPVQSVNTATGAVVLDADDIDDSSTTNKFVTAADITNLGNLSGTNTGDQDISGLATQVSLGNHEALTSSVHGISAFGATLVDDADASAARTTLGLGTAATTASTDYATSSQGALADTAIQPSGITNMVETTDSIDVLADVDTSTVAPTTDDLLKWDGTNFVPGTVSVDVDTPLTTALRGTDNPHIGAYPNQSFKVIDNPYKSVMVVADEAGNLKLLNSLGVNNIAVGFSVVEDGTEPDIEAVSGSERYSVISGDSDTKGANGLPIRQGFNLPDIGANPAPILISGGTIA